MLGGLGVIANQCIKAHDDSRCAKATLTAISDREPLLNRVGLLHIPDTLNRYNMLAVHTYHRRQASIDRCMIDLLGCRIDVGHDL